MTRTSNLDTDARGVATVAKAPITQVTYQRERLTDAFWEEVQPLLARHYAEIAVWHDIALDPDRQFYERVEAAGHLRIYTARLGTELIGYAAFFVRHNAHYRSSLQAGQDVLYLAPEHRRGRVGWRLLEFAESQLRAEGVQVLTQHAKVAHPELGELLRLKGYQKTDELWAKRLDGGSHG